MGCYHHLCIEEREDIMCLRRVHVGAREIARRLHRDKSTVSREIARNSCRAGSDRPYYRASSAQRRIVEDRWSPEQVAGRIRPETGRAAVSAATIYRAVAARGLDTSELAGTARGIASRLRHGGKRRHRRGEEERRGKIRVDHELAERPEEASSRSRLGDWEADTVVGRGSGPCLVSMVDRMSGLLEGGRAAARRKAEVAALSRQTSRTVIPDRGKELADWPRVKRKTGAQFYFCAPH